MTDEEMAYEYAKYDDNGRISVNDDKFKAFLAGLKAGRPQWHDLRKNPDDLPEDDREVLNEIGIEVCYIGDCWVYAHIEEATNADVVAWCEIPEFNEE